jgi:hypothetical protein
MDGKAKMITNGRVREKDPNVTASFAELAHDVIELAELQAKLLALDIQCTGRKTRTSLLLSLLAVCVLLGSIPVALFAIARVFVEQLGWSEAGGFAVAALIGLVLSAILLGVAWQRFRTGLNAMQRSREELSRNIAWIKLSLRSQPAAISESERPSKVEFPNNPR